VRADNGRRRMGRACCFRRRDISMFNRWGGIEREFGLYGEVSMRGLMDLGSAMRYRVAKYSRNYMGYGRELSELVSL
jgi:hypothetical protein